MSEPDRVKSDGKPDLDAHFEKVAQTYEKDGGGVQNSLCRALLTISTELNHPVEKTSVVLDNASGPGILTGELLQQCQSAEVPELHAADFSSAMIKVLNAKGWNEKYGVEAAVMDAQDLKYPNAMFSHIFMNLGIFALPDAVKGTKEIYRTLRPGGITLVTTIKSVGWVIPFQKAQKRIRPDAEQFQGMVPAKWAKPETIRDLLLQGGFEAGEVQVREAATDMKMVNFMQSQKDIMKMASGMIVRTWTDDEKARFDDTLMQEIAAEEGSGMQRQLEVWVGIATK